MKLQVHEDAGDAVITVSDNGQGIPAEKKSQIFDEYVQLQNKTRGDEQIGLGLGLLIVKRLSNLIGLKMELSSTLGEGTVFTLRLPVIDVSEDDRHQFTFASGDFIEDTLIVLVVDEEAIRQSMTSLLAQWGFDLDLLH